MTLITIEQRSGGHNHAVRLDDTFDFVNTLEYDAIDGHPNEHLQTTELAVEWFATRGLIHAESLETSDRDQGLGFEARKLAPQPEPSRVLCRSHVGCGSRVRAA